LNYYINNDNIKKAKATIIGTIVVAGIAGAFVIADTPVVDIVVEESYCKQKQAVLVNKKWHCYDIDKYNGRRNALHVKVKNNEFTLDDAKFALGVMRKEKLADLEKELKDKYYKTGKLSRAEMMVFINSSTGLEGSAIYLTDVTSDNIIDKLINNEQSK